MDESILLQSKGVRENLAHELNKIWLIDFFPKLEGLYIKNNLK